MTALGAALSGLVLERQLDCSLEFHMNDWLSENTLVDLTGSQSEKMNTLVNLMGS